MSAPRVTYFFVVEGPELEAQALLLAASLVAQEGPGTRMVGYLPQHEGQGAYAPPDAAAAAFAALGVDLRPMEVPGDLWAKPFPHGNKIIAACQKRDTEISVFLDSDMVCAAPLELGELARPGTVTAVPEGTRTWGFSHDRWERVYAHFGLDLPKETVRLTRGRRLKVLPYFNAGMVAFHENDPALPARFPELWLDTALEIDWNCRIAKKRPWLDQIALPVTLYRHGIGFTALRQHWNYSISERAWRPPGRKPIRLIHYHRFGYCRGWPPCEAAQADMAARLGPDAMAALAPLYGAIWHPPAEEAAE